MAPPRPAFLPPLAPHSTALAPPLRRPRPNVACSLSTSSGPPSRRSLLHGLVAAISAAALSPLPALAGRPEGVNRPDLLPATQTPVIDLERFFARGDAARMAQQLDRLEARTGFKVRVLTQRYPVTPGLAVREYWGVDERTVVVVADFFSGGGSLLHFTVGEEVYAKLPPRFWSLLTSEYGNKFFVDKNGPDVAVITAVEAIRSCLASGGVCKVPPSADAAVLKPPSMD